MLKNDRRLSEIVWLGEPEHFWRKKTKRKMTQASRREQIETRVCIRRS